MTDLSHSEELCLKATGTGSSLFTFLISPRVPTYSGAFFFLADQRDIVCFPKNVRVESPNVMEIFKLLWEAKKIKRCKSLQMGVGKLWNDEMIPNMVSEFKSDNI